MQRYVNKADYTGVIAAQSPKFNSMIPDQAFLTADVVWTLVAIKVLNNYYADKLTLWGLVEKKARKFVESKLTEYGATHTLQ